MILKLQDDKRRLQEENQMLARATKAKLEKMQALLAQRGSELATVQGAAKAAVLDLNAQKAALQEEKAKQAKMMSKLLRCGDAGSPSADSVAGSVPGGADPHHKGDERLRAQVLQLLHRLLVLRHVRAQEGQREAGALGLLLLYEQRAARTRATVLHARRGHAHVVRGGRESQQQHHKWP